MSKNKQRELNAFNEGIKLGKKGIALPNWKYRDDEAKAIIRGLMIGLMTYVANNAEGFTFYPGVDSVIQELKGAGFSNRQSVKLATVLITCKNENREVTNSELANSINIDITAKI